MADEKAPKPEPTQKTKKGAEIPVPKRGSFFANLRKIAKPKKAQS